MPGEIKLSIAGLYTLSGGSRTAVKTSRPWQPKLDAVDVSGKRDSCPLCMREQLDEHTPAEGWKTFQNLATPFPYHRLLIPTECWDEQTLRNLGGKDALVTMLRLAMEEVARTRESLFPTWVYTHIGAGAGQNFAHLHWHLCGAPGEPLVMGLDDVEFLSLLGSQHANFTAGLCGVRAGQVLIKSNSIGSATWSISDLRSDKRLLDELATLAHVIVALYNYKFGSPDYCLMLAMNGEREWDLWYTPILNNWGGSELPAALYYGTPFILPWPHDATLAFLRS